MGGALTREYWDSLTRKEKHELVLRLQRQHYTHKQISMQLDISLGVIRDLIYDPDRSKVKIRKARYKGTCADCGTPTSGNSYRDQSKRCLSCHQRLMARQKRKWTREAVIEAIQRWNREYGHPPKSGDWLKGRAEGRPEWAPPASAVYRSKSSRKNPFPSWADAIEAAGFPRPYIGVKYWYEPPKRRPKGREESEGRNLFVYQGENLTEGRERKEIRWKRGKAKSG